MSDTPEESTSPKVEDISDLSALSDTDPGDSVQIRRSPPSRGALEKETNKLLSKYRILRDALIEERVAQIDKQIAEAEEGRIPGLEEQLEGLERGRRERLEATHKRKQIKVEAILNDYKSKVQSIQDEKAAGEAELMSSIQQKPPRKGRKTPLGKRGREEDYRAETEQIDGDVAEIRQGMEARKESAIGDTRDLIHSD